MVLYAASSSTCGARLQGSVLDLGEHDSYTRQIHTNAEQFPFLCRTPFTIHNFTTAIRKFHPQTFAALTLCYTGYGRRGHMLFFPN